MVHAALLLRREPWQPVGMTLAAQGVAVQGGRKREKDEPATGVTKLVGGGADTDGNRRALAGKIRAEVPATLPEERKEGPPGRAQDEDTPRWHTMPAAVGRGQRAG